MILKMTLDLPADAAYIPIARALSATLLERLGVIRADIDDVAIVVGEVCSNVVRHAYANPERRYLVEVEYYLESVQISVTDYGVGFERRDVPPPRPGQLGGFGLWLVENIADRVEFRPVVHGGTRVRACLEIHYETPADRAQAAAMNETGDKTSIRGAGGTGHRRPAPQPEDRAK